MKAPSVLRGNGFAISRNLNPSLVCIEALQPLGRETRKHPASQIRKLQASVGQFGFVLPIVIDPANRVIAGWALVLAAKKLGLQEVPAVTIVDLDEARLRMLRLALNRLSEDSRWDLEALRLEFSDIVEISGDIDLRLSGFEMGEIDLRLGPSRDDDEDEIPPVDEASTPIAKPGDLWALGDHRILCGDARAPKSYARLLGDEKAQMVFSDPPWNIPIEGNVSGLGAIKHRDFAMGCGEMSAAAFKAFLHTTLGQAAAYSNDGSIHFICFHWSKLKELLAATAELFSELKNLCIWNKSNAGMGSLYRSKHELVFVFKKGTATHINNIELGRYGRHRSNVWDYPGQNVFSAASKGKLALHPTVKPVALVADAIRDCSNRNDLILDPFGGAGTTLIAAERTNRRARLIEIDPLYVDVTIRRWKSLTQRPAVCLEAGAPQSDVPTKTLAEAPTPLTAADSIGRGASS